MPVRIQEPDRILTSAELATHIKSLPSSAQSILATETVTNLSPRNNNRTGHQWGALTCIGASSKFNGSRARMYYFSDGEHIACLIPRNVANGSTTSLKALDNRTPPQSDVVGVAFNIRDQVWQASIRHPQAGHFHLRTIQGNTCFKSQTDAEQARTNFDIQVQSLVDNGTSERRATLECIIETELNYYDEYLNGKWFSKFSINTKHHRLLNIETPIKEA
ncbi:hypothetical protein [Shewanella sp. UCD-KL21]|uniref:hypothetical protein n=1 Tax=Shewanella sp. UCD-KL21 TaxID=1917164 RepID=UPI0009713F6E|nr:hypothetical protein [Shewanella sp. UCD-KL21]